MTKTFGSIELGGTFGGYEIVNQPANKLPQDVASAVSAANSSPLLGATYTPIWYVGKQTVNGVNHFFIAEDVRLAFETATKGLCGVGYKPVVYIGKQVVRGISHFIVCEARGIYPGAQPYAVTLCLNIFEGSASVVGVAPIGATERQGLFGYAFNW